MVGWFGLVDWLVGWSVGVVGWLVLLIGWLMDCLVDLVCLFFSWFVGWLLRYLVGLVRRLIVSVDLSVG